jgi:hypothetical protein
VAYFNSGSDQVEEYEYKKVLEILEGPSPWHDYIRPNLDLVRQTVASGNFHIVSSGKFDQVMKALGGEVPGAIGVTNKQTGEITMKEWGLNSGRSYLLAVLHECVHLVSHPPEQGKPHSTAWGHLGGGLLEGMVECVTEDILKAQKLALPSEDSGMIGYQGGATGIAREILNNFSVPFFARVLFKGNGEQLKAMMDFLYSPVGWVRIKNLITIKRFDGARMEMTRLRKQEDDRRNQALQGTLQQLRAQAAQRELTKTLLDVVMKLP